MPTKKVSKKKKPTAKKGALKAPAKKRPKPRTAKRVGVTVLAYRGGLVFIPDDLKDTNQFVPTSASGRFGTVMLHTKADLRISREAIELMKKIPRGRDAIGDISWWKCGDGSHAFSWFGAVFAYKKPMDELVGDRDWQPHRHVEEMPFTLVPNDVPDEVAAGIKNYGEHGLWKGPYGIGYPEDLDEMLAEGKE